MRNTKRWLAVALSGFLALQSGISVFAEETPQDTEAGITAGKTQTSEEVSESSKTEDSTSGKTTGTMDDASTEENTEANNSDTDNFYSSSDSYTSSTETTETAAENTEEAAYSASSISTEYEKETDKSSESEITPADMTPDEKTQQAENDKVFYSMDGETYSELSVKDSEAAVDLGSVEIPFDVWLRVNSEEAQKNTVNEAGSTVLTIGDYKVTVTAEEKKEAEEQHVITYSVNGGAYQEVSFDADGNAVIELDELDAIPYTINFRVDGESAKDYAPQSETFEAEVDGHKITLKASAKKKEDSISYTVNGSTTEVKAEDAQDDGSYLIELPEDTSFPLQITFTVNGEEQVVEFAASDSTVEVAGKTIRLHVAEKKTHTLTYNNGWYDQEIYLDEKQDDGTWLIRMNSTDISYPTEVTFHYDGEEYKHTFTSEDDVFEIGAYRVRLEVPFMYYNTGNSKEAAYASDMEDGAYKIWLGQDPFFPFEVQITCNGTKQNYWFKNPDDSFEINGKRIEASAYFTGNVVTQMSLEVAGKEIVVYPEEKEFKDSAIVLFSVYYPLQEVQLSSVDLSGITPVELTQVKVTNVFTGENQVSSGQSVVFKKAYYDSDDYVVGSVDGTIDLSASSGNTVYEMIVGTPDQLDSSNVRYKIPIITSDAKNWLNFTVGTDSNAGVRTLYDVSNISYSYYSGSSRNIAEYSIYTGAAPYTDTPYITCAQNTKAYPNAPRHLRAFKGSYKNAEETQNAIEITDQLFGADMNSAGNGFQVSNYGEESVTFVSYDAHGNVTGCLPTYLNLNMYDSISTEENHIDFSLVSLNPDYIEYSSYHSAYNSYSYGTHDDVTNYEYSTYREIPANEQLSLTISRSNADAIDACYEGLYDTIDSAKAAGAADISDKLTATDKANGYIADFSGGKEFTVFMTTGDNTVAKKFKVTTKQGFTSLLSGYALVPFTGLVDKDGNNVNCWLLNSSDDSYAEGNYVTYFVDESTDLSSLAPTYGLTKGLKLYRTGSSNSIESGKDYENFEGQRAVQYTSSSENGENAKNYWVRVLKAVDGQQLFITSLIDSNANTTVKDGVTYSTREVLLDPEHSSMHNIFVANLGKEDIPNLKVELQSNTLELDSFLTLSGNYNLEGFNSMATHSQLFYDQRAKNAATVRLHAKAGVDAGSDVDGTLTFSSNGKTLLVLTLTGTIGSPQIITNDIPDAVKYVPYGTMIQNNNKYSSNSVRYTLTSGTLPDGLELKPNGEIYGVPKETGTFEFYVSMENSRSDFRSDFKKFTINVLDNTDENVDNATDEDYYLINRLPATVNDDSEEMLRSNGVLGEYRAVYLDGEKLTEGTDYDAESGSTRITLKKQTLQKVGEGKHTIGIEFRQTASNTSKNKEEGDLKKAAQNFTVKHVSSSDNSGSGNSSTSSSGSSSRGSSSESSGSSSSSSSSTGTIATGTRAGGTTAAQGQGNNQSAASQTTNVATEQNPMIAVPVLYTVVRKDTLRSISLKFYGTEDYWEKIYNDNRDVLSNPNRIYPKQVLKLYAVDLGDGTYLYPSDQGGIVIPATVPVSQENNTVNQSTSNPDASSAEENKPVSTTYIVEKGDSLSKIARKVYGSENNWRKIYNANRDQIRNPNRIYPGQNLNIPE